mgnify:CR=1 FL=1
MNTDTTKEDVLRYFTAERLAEYLADVTGGKVKRDGAGYKIDEKKRITGIGGLTVYTDAGQVKWKLFSGGGPKSQGDIFDALEYFEHITGFPEKKIRGAELAGIPISGNGQAHKATGSNTPAKGKEPPRITPETSSLAEYQYRDPDGNTVKLKRRYEKPYSGESDKTFRFFSPDGLDMKEPKQWKNILYNLDSVIETAGREGVIWITEGEKDADTLTNQSVTATTAEYGAGTWEERHTAALAGAHCIIIADKDEPGRKHAGTVAAALIGTAASVKVIETPKGKDATEFFDQGGTLPDLVKLAEDAPEWMPEAERVSSWAEAETLIGEITWSWPGWMPNGLLTMLVSESGKGKSALALRIAACFIRGDCWPDGSQFTGETGKVIWCESEGALSVNVDRARKAGVPFEKMLSPLADPLEEFSIDRPEHVERLRAMAARPDVRCIILDSLSGATQQDENSSAMLHSVKKLASIAAESGKAFLLLHHLNKGLSDGDGVHQRQIRGSSAIIQTARVVWAIDAPDDTDETHRRLSMVKNNLAAYAPPVGFRIAEGGITFTGDAPKRRSTDTVKDLAANFLLDILASGPVPSSEVERQATERGISPNAIARAKKEIDADSERRDGRWITYLKTNRTPPPDDGRGRY